MLLAEELLLLGLDPERGTVVNDARPQLLVGLAGALVGELALAGAVDLSGKRFVASGPAPADPLLRAVHDRLAQPRGRRGADQLRPPSSPLSRPPVVKKVIAEMQAAAAAGAIAAGGAAAAT